MNSTILEIQKCIFLSASVFTLSASVFTIIVQMHRHQTTNINHLDFLQCLDHIICMLTAGRGLYRIFIPSVSFRSMITGNLSESGIITGYPGSVSA